jgi:hypothetical protein
MNITGMCQNFTNSALEYSKEALGYSAETLNFYLIMFKQYSELICCILLILTMWNLILTRSYHKRLVTYNTPTHDTNVRPRTTWLPNTQIQNQFDSDDSSDVGELIDLHLNTRAQAGGTIIVGVMHELLQAHGAMRNSDITGILGFKTEKHNGYLTLTLMKNHPDLFGQDQSSRMWYAKY